MLHPSISRIPRAKTHSHAAGDARKCPEMRHAPATLARKFSNFQLCSDSRGEIRVHRRDAGSLLAFLQGCGGKFSCVEAQSILASRRNGSALSQRSMTHFFKVSLWLGYLKCSRSLREALFLNSHVPASARLVPGFLLKFSAQLLSVARQVGHQARNKGPCVAAAQLCRGSERGASSPSGPAQGTPKWETAFTADVRVNVLSFCTNCSGTFAELIYASDLV